MSLDETRFVDIWQQFLTELKDLDPHAARVIREVSHQFYSVARDDDAPEDWAGQVALGQIEASVSTLDPQLETSLQLLARTPLQLDYYLRIRNVLVSSAAKVGVTFDIGFEVPDTNLTAVCRIPLENSDRTLVGLIAPPGSAVEGLSNEKAIKALQQVTELTNVALHSDGRSTSGQPLKRVDEFSMSYPEEVIYRAFGDTDFIISPQAHIVWGGKIRYRIDFLIFYGGKPYAIEIDGHAYHARRDQRQRDIKRDRELRKRGIHTVRFTAKEVDDDPKGSINELMETLREERSRDI